MEHNINSLIGYRLEATDGDIGEVKEFYFDDESWKIRYLILKTGNWLSGREVLISPDAIVKTTWRNGLFPVNLTRKQISDSPDIATDKPVSRQQEIQLYSHYAWPEYWGSKVFADSNTATTTSVPIMGERVAKDIHGDKKPDSDLNLYSTARVTGYIIYAKDGQIGHVNDFIFDDKTWQLVYLVIDTQNWIGGKKVLIPIKLIKEVDWTKFEVFLDMTIANVKNAHLFEESKFNPVDEIAVKIVLPIIPTELH